MNVRRFSTGLTLGLLLLVAACGGDSSSSTAVNPSNPDTPSNPSNPGVRANVEEISLPATSRLRSVNIALTSNNPSFNNVPVRNNDPGTASATGIVGSVQFDQASNAIALNLSRSLLSIEAFGPNDAQLLASVDLSDEGEGLTLVSTETDRIRVGSRFITQGTDGSTAPLLEFIVTEILQDSTTGDVSLAGDLTLRGPTVNGVLDTTAGESTQPSIAILNSGELRGEFSPASATDPGATPTPAPVAAPTGSLTAVAVTNGATLTLDASVPGQVGGPFTVTARNLTQQTTVNVDLSGVGVLNGIGGRTSFEEFLFTIPLDPASFNDGDQVILELTIVDTFNQTSTLQADVVTASISTSGQVDQPPSGSVSAVAVENGATLTLNANVPAGTQPPFVITARNVTQSTAAIPVDISQVQALNNLQDQTTFSDFAFTVPLDTDNFNDGDSVVISVAITDSQDRTATIETSPFAANISVQSSLLTGTLASTPAINGVVLTLDATVPNGVQAPFTVTVRNLTQATGATELDLSEVVALNNIQGRTTFEGFSFTVPLPLTEFTNNDQAVVALQLQDTGGQTLNLESAPIIVNIDDSVVPPPPPVPVQAIDQITLEAGSFILAQTETTEVIGFGPRDGFGNAPEEFDDPDTDDVEGPFVISPEFGGDPLISRGVEVDIEPEMNEDPADFAARLEEALEELQENEVSSARRPVIVLCGGAPNLPFFPNLSQVDQGLDLNGDGDFFDVEVGIEDENGQITDRRVVNGPNIDLQPNQVVTLRERAPGQDALPPLTGLARSFDERRNAVPPLFVRNQRLGEFVFVNSEGAILNPASKVQNPVTLSGQKLTITRNSNNFLTASVTPANFDEVYRINYA
ncbi:MAG: hypothetical protein AAFX40_12140, partial [Cyanobacteria bacterium J06639_1]